LTKSNSGFCIRTNSHNWRAEDHSGVGFCSKYIRLL